MLPAVLLLLLGSCSIAFQQPFLRSAAAPGLSASTLDSPTTTKPEVSSRLSKARLLLEEFQDNTEASSSSSSSSAFSPEPESAETTNNVVVPDTYWSNGHLEPNDVSGQKIVTRWARGVKVAEPLVKYDPAQTERRLFRQPTKWLLRNVQIALPMGLWAAGVISDDVLRNRSNRRARARQLTGAISNLGPAIIKGGQALASRPDLLPSEYLMELQKLQDDVPRFSNALALQTVQDELGLDDFNEVFELVEPEPIAAASIGQVYKARLRENGETVALKIQRPSCEKIIALDLYVLRWWSGVYNWIFKILNRDIDLQSIIDDFGELIYREIDYVAEAANAQRFNELYAGLTPDVFVPKVYSDYTTNKVLTMEWVDGVRLTDRASLQRFGLDESKLVDTLVQCSLRQILENGFFHADPHAGNLLACPDGRLCYLDFGACLLSNHRVCVVFVCFLRPLTPFVLHEGMMSYAASNQRNGFLLAVVHIVNRDWEELVKLYVRLGFIPQGTDLRPIEIALEDALPDILSADITELNFKNVINELGDIMYVGASGQ